jgi:hypothetical protein
LNFQKPTLLPLPTRQQIFDGNQLSGCPLPEAVISLDQIEERELLAGVSPAKIFFFLFV